MQFVALSKPISSPVRHTQSPGGVSSPSARTPYIGLFQPSLSYGDVLWSVAGPGSPRTTTLLGHLPPRGRVSSSKSDSSFYSALVVLSASMVVLCPHGTGVSLLCTISCGRP